jgi:hypothetical protein
MKSSEVDDMGIDAVRLAHPWPETRPHPGLVGLGWSGDGGGRELIDTLIRQKGRAIMLEIGVFVGSSARRWLEQSSQLVLICVDAWDNPQWPAEMVACGELDLAEKLKEAGGAERVFRTNLWEYRDRVIAIRGYAPEALKVLVDNGVRPDIIYVDADKEAKTLLGVAEMFPNAVFCGDDWSWSEAENPYFYPIRAGVKALAKKRNAHLIVRKATWVISDQPPSLRVRLDLVERWLADISRPLRRWLKRRSPSGARPAGD